MLFKYISCTKKQKDKNVVDIIPHHTVTYLPVKPLKISQANVHLAQRYIGIGSWVFLIDGPTHLESGRGVERGTVAV
jgi:hypothetical protein